MIKILLLSEFIINLVILLLYFMHMFQQNSYFTKKHFRWIFENKKRIITQYILILISFILTIFKYNIASFFILTFTIYYNLPKVKSKIPLKITNRIIRLFSTEFILIILFISINQIINYIYLKLFILNIISPFLCLLANLLNFPIDFIGKKKYINDAKKILDDMPDLIVIGVTGSYGKTSVKNYLYKTLSTKYEVLMTPKNYNTTLGVVKTIRENLKPFHQIFICEMGATNIGDIKEICDIVNPKIGIITAIGPQHLESFKSIDNIIKTKFELARSIKKNNGTIFLNFNNEYLCKQSLDVKTISYGINDESLDYNSYNLVSSSKGLSFKILDKSNKISEHVYQFNSKLIGKHNIINMTGAIAIANHLGIPLKNLIPSIRDIQSVEHRLKVIPKGKLTIIDDSYNSNPISSKSALDCLSDFEGTKIIVTPGLIELGNNEKKYNFELGQYISSICDYAYLVGKKNSKILIDGILSKGFNKDRIFIVNTPQEAINQISNLQIKDNITILLENDLPDNYNK